MRIADGGMSVRKGNMETMNTKSSMYSSDSNEEYDRLVDAHLDDSRLRLTTMETILDGHGCTYKWFRNLSTLFSGGFSLKTDLMMSSFLLLVFAVATPITTLAMPFPILLRSALVTVYLVSVGICLICMIGDLMKVHDAHEMKKTGCDTWIRRHVLKDSWYKHCPTVTAKELYTAVDASESMALEPACWDYGSKSFRAVADARDSLKLLSDMYCDCNLSDESLVSVNALMEIMDRLESMKTRPSKSKRKDLSELLKGLGDNAVNCIIKDYNAMKKAKDEAGRRREEQEKSESSRMESEADAIADSILYSGLRSDSESQVITERKRLDDIVRNMTVQRPETELDSMTVSQTSVQSD